MPELARVPELPPLARAAERNTSQGRRALQVGALLVLVLLGLLTLLFIGVKVGPVALATGLVLATLPVPLYLWTALRVDRFEPEPLPLLAWAFFWGASAATFIALVLNTAGQAVVGSSFGSDVGELYGSSVSAPVVEEGAKGAVLFALYRWRRSEFHGLLDGVVYAAMVGLGFAMTENVLYYGRAALEGGVPLAAVFFIRGVMAPFSHPVFTAMTGIGLGIAAQRAGGGIRMAAPAAGLAGAVALHALWNTSATVGGGAVFIGVFFLVMLPVFVGLIVVVAAALRREGRLIAEYLQPEIARGVLGPGDLIVLSNLRERRRLRRAARRDGTTARRACREWVSAATDLAFLRHRLARGLPTGSSSPQADESSLVARLSQLRPALGSAANAVSHAAAQRAAGLAQLAATRAAGGPAAGADPAAGQPATAWAPWSAGQPGAGVAPGQPGTGAPAQAATVPAAPPAGWYPDPWDQRRWRWWDGGAWTHHVAG